MRQACRRDWEGLIGSWSAPKGSRKRRGALRVGCYSKRLGDQLERREPRLSTSEQRKAKRRGRILIDVMRNAWDGGAR